MIELSNERIKELLHEEAVKKEDSDTILRGIYTRYMRLYEWYFADIDALNNDRIAELNKYHEETISLIKYYYMDIPMDVCTAFREFEKKYTDNLLGPGWHDFLFDSYKEFRKEITDTRKSEKMVKAAFSKEVLDSFYDAMDYVFRSGFGTGSQTASNIMSGISSLLFGKKSKE